MNPDRLTEFQPASITIPCNDVASDCHMPIRENYLRRRFLGSLGGLTRCTHQVLANLFSVKPANYLRIHSALYQTLTLCCHTPRTLAGTLLRP
jgi:hypothetical protein